MAPDTSDDVVNVPSEPAAEIPSEFIDPQSECPLDFDGSPMRFLIDVPIEIPVEIPTEIPAEIPIDLPA